MYSDAKLMIIGGVRVSLGVLTWYVNVKLQTAL